MQIPELGMIKGYHHRLHRNEMDKDVRGICHRHQRGVPGQPPELVGEDCPQPQSDPCLLI